MDRNEFLNKIKEVEKNSKFKNICLNNYEFRSTPSHFPGQSANKMLMGNENYVLNDFSLSQFLSRIGLNCSAINNDRFISANSELIEKLISQVLMGNEEYYSTAYIRDNNILAAHSKNYKPLQISSLIETIEAELNRRYKNFTFEDGFYSDEITICDYAINDLATERAYKRAFNLEDAELKVILRFATSNLGLSGANLFPLSAYKRQTGKQFYYLPTSDKTITLKHEGDASIEKFRKNLNVMFSLTETLPERISELDNIKINYPTHCCINLAEKVGIPAKYISDIAENVAFVYPNTTITAKQLYILFTDVQRQVEGSIQRFNLSERVAKAIRILKEHSEDVDIPRIKWKRLQNITADEGQDFIPSSSDSDIEQMKFAC